MNDRPDPEHDGKYSWHKYAVKLEDENERYIEVLGKITTAYRSHENNWQRLRDAILVAEDVLKSIETTSLPKPSAEELGKKYGIKHSTDCRHAEIELTGGHLIVDSLKYSDPGTPQHEYTFKSWPTQTDDILLVLLWLKDRVEEMFPTAQMDNAEWRALGRIYDAIENLPAANDSQQQREE